ncbi:hypothetical protein EVG20_g6506 [Dentipellis fragilis]|uniref:Uncharacterized protein n=1 Tax=Dentipellis fragilis TaxID=205917 RepID=A0A4Y9YKC1_9AGAM|nr:hypothetical protein EVG20_g6506 [Dentipellis fragilis]
MHISLLNSGSAALKRNLELLCMAPISNPPSSNRGRAPSRTPPRPLKKQTCAPMRPSKSRIQHVPTEPDSPTPVPEVKSKPSVIDVPFMPLEDYESDDSDDDSDFEALGSFVRICSSDSDYTPSSSDDSIFYGQGSTIAGTQDGAEVLVMSLHPYSRPKEESISTLFQLVWAVLPPVPPLYESRQLRKTKRPSATDCAHTKRLTRVVYLPEIFLPIEGMVAQRLRSISVDFNNPRHREFAMRVFPWHTAIGAVKKDTGEEFDPIPEEYDAAYPFVSSAHGRKRAKPDGILVLRGEHPNEVTPLCLEVKTHAIISGTQNPLQHVQTSISGHRYGAHKFNMPRFPHESDDHGCSILTQIWSQLIHWDAKYGILSSMDTTTFYARQGDTLYISEAYGPNDETLFYVVCWILLAIEAFPSLELDLPLPDTSWWSRKTRLNKESGFC